MNKGCQLYGVLCDDYFRKMQDISRRVYDPQGLAPCIHTSGGGNQEPKVVILNNGTVTNGLGDNIPHGRKGGTE